MTLMNILLQIAHLILNWKSQPSCTFYIMMVVVWMFSIYLFDVFVMSAIEFLVSVIFQAKC